MTSRVLTANGKVVIAYSDMDNSFYGTAIVGTVSGTSISFGTPVVFVICKLLQLGILLLKVSAQKLL